MNDGLYNVWLYLFHIRDVRDQYSDLIWADFDVYSIGRVA